MTAKKKVVIVGGGAAGWLTAGRLGAALAPGVDVTLIESPTVPTIGVGEGTWPSMRTTLQKIGLSEREVLRHCEASFKQGTLFRNWVTGEANDSYCHPFSLPADYSSLNLAQWWQQTGRTGDFCTAVTPQATVAGACRAPKLADMPDYAFALNYGYHLDAGKFAELLRRHSIDRLGVTYLSADVAEVVRGDNGLIAHLKVSGADPIYADLFVDCTGQKALLIDGCLGSEFRPVNHVLPNNRAVVAQVPYQQPDAEIQSCTVSTAQRYGWIWDIGLQSRRGVGYVHDASYLSEAEARSELLNYIATSTPGFDTSVLETRTIHFEPGYRPQPWRGNCVAIGLSAGFIEPLEASALAMIEQGVSLLVDNFPSDAELLGPVSRMYNQKMQYYWRTILEFLSLHYALSQRDDSPYWRAARDSTRLMPELADKLSLWRARAPAHSDAPRIDELFPAASYQYVWLGMHGPQGSGSPGAGIGPMESERIEPALHEVRERTLQMMQALPGNRNLLNQLAR